MTDTPLIYPAAAQASFTGKTLIIPIVSVANVAQLSVDLLIASFSLKRLAIFDPQFFIPVIGAREDGEEGLTTPLELYGAPQSSIVVMQQRSPVLKSSKQDFVSSLLQFIETSGFGSVLFLSGVDLTNRTDSQMLTPIYQIQPSTSPPLAKTSLELLNSLPIPKYTSPVVQQEGDTIPFIPGGGLTRRILSSLPGGWKVPTASLVQFVSEGDNRADARMFAALVAKVLGQDPMEWRQPESWKAGLYGTPHNQALYG